MALIFLSFLKKAQTKVRFWILKREKTKQLDTLRNHVFFPVAYVTVQI